MILYFNILYLQNTATVPEERPSDYVPPTRGRRPSESQTAQQRKLVIPLDVNRYAFKVALWFIYTDQIFPYIKGNHSIVLKLSLKFSLCTSIL